MGQRSVEGWRARAGYRTHRRILECGIASGVFTQQAKELFSTGGPGATFSLEEEEEARTALTAVFICPGLRIFWAVGLPGLKSGSSPASRMLSPCSHDESRQYVLSQMLSLHSHPVS